MKGLTHEHLGCHSPKHLLEHHTMTAVHALTQICLQFTVILTKIHITI